MLVERGRQKIDAILVPPRKIRRVSGLRLDELVVGRDSGGVALWRGYGKRVLIMMPPGPFIQPERSWLKSAVLLPVKRKEEC